MPAKNEACKLSACPQAPQLLPNFPFANSCGILYSVSLYHPRWPCIGLTSVSLGFFQNVNLKEVTMKNIFALLALFAFSGAAVVVPQTNAFAAEYANKGKVLETMDASIYTYMQVSTDKGPVWIAASKTKVKKGDIVSYPDGAVMTNFFSKSLNRTFDKLIMVDKVSVVKN
jgi:hypothetical protein